MRAGSQKLMKLEGNLGDIKCTFRFFIKQNSKKLHFYNTIKTINRHKYH